MLTVKQNSPTVKRKGKDDGFAEILREAVEFFGENNVQMVSGFSEILKSDNLFSEYVNRLTSQMDPDEAEQLEQLLVNQRLGMLQEATVGQTSPLYGLAMPTVRKLWVKTALKNAIPTETAKVPSFTISWMEPFLRDADGTKHLLPQALRVANSLAEKPKLTSDYFAVPADPDDADNNLLTKTVIGGVGASVANHDAIDPILFIDKVKVEVLAANGTDTTQVEVSLGEKGKCNQDTGFYAVVTAYGLDTDKTKVTDTLFGSINLETGVFSLASVKGKIKAASFKGWLTQENNTRTQSVSFEIRRKDVRIGTGAHINANLPIEWLQDNMALFNIDSTVEVVDTMSNVVAQKLDMEIADFFEDSFKNSGSPFVGKFDVKPSAGFAGSPTEWRHELRTTIEWWATKLKEYTQFIQGYFVIFGNPVDVNLLPDIQWSFRSTSGERGGVNVNYDFGVMTASNVYQVVTSSNVLPGKLRMFFVPTVDNYMTYKYYPYTFNIEKGYLDTQNQNVPSIMMTKRHKLEELIPMQVQIEILHNDGSLISSYAL